MNIENNFMNSTYNQTMENPSLIKNKSPTFKNKIDALPTPN
jgi:hypothetical protein